MTLSDDNGSVVATVGDSKISYSVTAPDGSARAISVESFNNLRVGDRLSLRFSGFNATGTARGWLAPVGVSLGEVKLSGGTGTVEGTLPDTLTDGDIRIMTAAESIDGAPVVVAFGAQIEKTSSSQTPWSWVLLIVVGLAVLGGFLIPAARRRKQSQ